jgi:hypothetical protein
MQQDRVPADHVAAHAVHTVQEATATVSIKPICASPCATDFVFIHHFRLDPL